MVRYGVWRCAWAGVVGGGLGCGGVESIQDVVARLDRDQGAVDAAATRVEAVRGVAEELLGRFAELGVTDGASVSALRQAMDTLARSRSGLVDMAATVESAKRIVAATEWSPGGPPSSGSGRSEEVSTQPEPVSGEELAEPSEPKGLRGLTNFFARRGDDVQDVAESAGKLLDIGWQSVGVEPTPTTGLSTSTVAHTAPKIDVPPAPSVGSGSILLAGFVTAVVGVKATEKFSSVAHRMWKARGRDNK